MQIYRLLGALAAVALLGGCNVCADLDNRMCTDLGDESCKLWKEKAMNFEAQAKTRGGRRNFLKSLLFGDDASICEASGKDETYAKILEGTKKSLEALKQAEARSAP
jgi:hypothetical protein